MPITDEFDKRVIIYPAYLNSKISVQGGRRIPKSQACENPNVLEITDCCTKGLNLKAEWERNSYPRQWWVVGRVRVQLKNEDGSPCNPDIPDRKTLFIKVAQLVPQHPMRSKEALAKAAQKEKQEREAAARAAASTSAGPSKPSGKKGKKGRK